MLSLAQIALLSEGFLFLTFFLLLSILLLKMNPCTLHSTFGNLMLITFAIILILAYLLGSINSAILVSKLMGLTDPRKQGSGNPGTTNVLRGGGKKAAAIVLVGDVLKGVIPVVAGCLLGIHGLLLGLIGLAAIVGHMFPIFFKFKGGKGVATTLGVIFSLSLILGTIMLLIFLIIVAITRYVSLGSICAIAATPIIALLINHTGYFLPLMITAILVAWRHKENIYRLRDGVENKVSFR